jgi:hypothetical protein
MHCQEEEQGSLQLQAPTCTQSFEVLSKQSLNMTSSMVNSQEFSSSSSSLPANPELIKSTKYDSQVVFVCLGIKKGSIHILTMF